MNLVLRLLRVIVAALRRERVDLFAATTVRFRVWPTDMDINWHLTNSRYLSFMDLGRADFLIRAGLGRTVLRNRWLPVLGAANISFRRPIGPLRQVQLHTRLLCWDEKWFYMEQRFETDAGTAAVATVRGLFRGRGGSVPTAELLEAAQYSGPVPAMPPAVAAFSEFERGYREAA